jgi:hypothetical protein
VKNDDERSGTESADTDAGQDAIFNKFATARNGAISFWAMLGLFLLFESYAPVSISSDSKYYIFVATLVRATIAFWAYADALARNYQRDWRIILMMGSIMLWELVIPVYLVISRGWKGAAKSCLRFAGYLLLAAVFWYGVVGVLEIFDIHEVGNPTIIFDRLHS